MKNRKKVKLSLSHRLLKKPNLLRFETKIPNPRNITRKRAQSALKNLLRLSVLPTHTPTPKNRFSTPLRVLKPQKTICEKRHDRRVAIMKLTRGKGMSIKQAKHTNLSKVRCK